MIELAISLHKVSIDKDGEATIVLKIPESHLVQAAQLPALRGQELYAQVYQHDEKRPEASE